MAKPPRTSQTGDRALEEREIERAAGPQMPEDARQQRAAPNHVHEQVACARAARAGIASRPDQVGGRERHQLPEEHQGQQVPSEDDSYRRTAVAKRSSLLVAVVEVPGVDAAERGGDREHVPEHEAQGVDAQRLEFEEEPGECPGVARIEAPHQVDEDEQRRAERDGLADDAHGNQRDENCRNDHDDDGGEASHHGAPQAQLPRAPRCMGRRASSGRCGQPTWR